MAEKVILAGGFEETIELCELCGYEIIGIADRQNGNWRYPYLGTDEEVITNSSCLGHIPVIVAMDQPFVRKRAAALYQNAGFGLKSLISPKAFISPSAQIGKGCIVQSLCHISANAVLGECVKVNIYANIMHDVVMDNYVTIAPNAVVLGKVRIEEGAYIGGQFYDFADP